MCCLLLPASSFFSQPISLAPHFRGSSKAGLNQLQMKNGNNQCFWDADFYLSLVTNDVYPIGVS